MSSQRPIAPKPPPRDRDSATVGGQARQDAAAKGAAELRPFDLDVQQMLINASRSICSGLYRFYRGKDGYLCGSGSHFVSHDVVDDMLLRGIPLYIECVNNDRLGLRHVAPPADGWLQPMHWTPARRVTNGFVPMKLKHDGSEHADYQEAFARC